MNHPHPERTPLERTVREEWGRLTALLLAQFRRLDLVEDALADAVARAADRWRPEVDGTPDNPAAWLLTTARRRIIDQLRSEAVAARRQPLLVVDARLHHQPVRAEVGDEVTDDLLRLVLMCTHPAITPDAASALALRLVLGVSTHDIARLFLVPEPTMAARLTRAKKKIIAAAIPFAVPDLSALSDRMAVLARTAYLAFTAGYAPGSGQDLLRVELAGEAIRLITVVREHRPDEPVLIALLALMQIQHSRRDARLDSEGELVLLADQDRTRWHRTEVDAALDLLAHPRLTGPIDLTTASYALQARIAAEHALAPTAADTRWDRIVAGYDQLLRLAPNPGAALARAVAIAEADGPDAGLAALDTVELPGSHRPAAVRAELLARLDRHSEALAAYDEAIRLCDNAVEEAHLEQRRQGSLACRS
ncbi:RNA polymerase sigma factor [Propionibacteriaceae bacterium Y1685]|uniref:RNA polymerase sigma factor n=1 Tax=Microlunatus sp. Y1700 TaxID=3418487 RepID=UPI003B78C2B9